MRISEGVSCSLIGQLGENWTNRWCAVEADQVAGEVRVEAMGSKSSKPSRRRRVLSAGDESNGATSYLRHDY